MDKPKNPHWGQWGVNWDDPREASDALGTTYYAGRWSNSEPMEDDLPYGFHIEEDPFDSWDSGE